MSLFEGSGDIGAVRRPGSIEGDSSGTRYILAGSGENMWSTDDECFFAWKLVGGDITIAADISLLGVGTHRHRKACLVIRQSLDPDSAYASAALHADGLASLQYRDAPGETTHDIRSNVNRPRRVRIEKRGDTFTLSVSGANGSLEFAGGSATVCLKDPFYVGLAVCSHDPGEIEKAVFDNIELRVPDPLPEEPKLFSTLETVSILTGNRQIVHVFAEHIEAPNWLPDGLNLIYNSAGRLYRIAVAGGPPTQINTGFATRCNNDHGISPDGRTLAISDHSQPPYKSVIYTLPVQGGAPSRITEASPSYWHGWSPDGRTLVYCGQRGGRYGVFTVPADGGDEKRITTTGGLDDGPEFSPDGKYIYFNSDRSGSMQIWRVAIDGTSMRQFTFDNANNWFPHLSPNGGWMVYLSYDKDVVGHPAYQHVTLRLMSLDDRSVRVLVKLFGGQGTINVPSWAPDGRHFAFVSYAFR